MELFISRNDLTKQETRSRAFTWIFRAAAAGTLILYIILCLTIRTVNARAVTWTMIVSMTLLGWFCIGFYMHTVRPARARTGHLKMLLSGKTEEFEGVLRLSGPSVQVPKSIRIRRIALEGEPGPNPTEEPELKRLNLDEELMGRMPPEGSRIRVRAVNEYITGVEVLAEGSGETGKSGQRGTARRIWGKLSALIIPFILWTMAVVIIGGFIFSRITDTDPRHKIVIYADCDIRNGAELADLLERQLGDPIRMVKVRSFTYDLFSTAGIEKADLYIVSASKAVDLRSWFAPLPENLQDREGLLMLGGKPCGIPVYAPDAAEGAIREYLDYDHRETYYLVFSAASQHYSGNEGSADDRAADAAAALLEIP